MPGSYYQDAYRSGLSNATAILESMIEEIEEYWEDDQAVDQSSPLRPKQSPTTTEVFIVHGHDHGAKETVARFLESLDLIPIILHERPDEGRTIIEKFEDYSQTGYAIALLTPDDIGGTDADNLRPRARQNVILELGFFLGSLGRGRVSALVKGDLEIPSDYSGVLFTEIDDSGGWKMKLAIELKQAGFDVDLNKLA